VAKYHEMSILAVGSISSLCHPRFLADIAVMMKIVWVREDFAVDITY